MGVNANKPSDKKGMVMWNFFSTPEIPKSLSLLPTRVVINVGIKKPEETTEPDVEYVKCGGGEKSERRDFIESVYCFLCLEKRSLTSGMIARNMNLPDGSVLFVTSALRSLRKEGRVCGEMTKDGRMKWTAIVK